jgi:hypothetical protein
MATAEVAVDDRLKIRQTMHEILQASYASNSHSNRALEYRVAPTPFAA